MDAAFVALDVETANQNIRSICQIGIVPFENGQPMPAWQALVNPRERFLPCNVRLHGITEDRVRDAPTFSALYPQLRSLIEGRVVVAHTSFDRHALACAAAQWGLPEITCTWVDSVRVARLAWPELKARGYSLKVCASHLGIRFRHHDAAEDARAAGMVVAHAISETPLSLSRLVTYCASRQAGDRSAAGLRTGRSHPVAFPERVSRKGAAGGPLCGEVVAFTGELSLSRREAADLAAAAGCDVKESVTRQTTLLIVGDPVISRLRGNGQSTKLRKALALLEAGHPIRIIGEDEFMRLMGRTIRDCTGGHEP